MIPRVQTALDVKKAIDDASSQLSEIGFDASVLEDGYDKIKYTIEIYSNRDLSPGPDENILVVPGGGKIDINQMVRHRRVVEFQRPDIVSRN
jgi:hypothetical protein